MPSTGAAASSILLQLHPALRCAVLRWPCACAFALAAGPLWNAVFDCIPFCAWSCHAVGHREPADTQELCTDTPQPSGTRVPALDCCCVRICSGFMLDGGFVGTTPQVYAPPPTTHNLTPAPLEAPCFRIAFAAARCLLNLPWNTRPACAPVCVASGLCLRCCMASSVLPVCSLLFTAACTMSLCSCSLFAAHNTLHSCAMHCCLAVLWQALRP
jgi:hypothetical protein